MPRLCFDQIVDEARKRGIVLERRRQTIDGTTYRYEVTSRDGSVTAECENLEEAWSEIYWSETR